MHKMFSSFIFLRVLSGFLIATMISQSIFFSVIASGENTPAFDLSTALSIQNLIAQNSEYTNTLSNTTHILDDEKMTGISGFENKDTPFFSGSLEKKIVVRDSIKKTKRIAGVRGDISLAFSLGTTISTLSGEMIDPRSIGIFSTNTGTTDKARNFMEKKNPKRFQKGSGTILSAPDVFEFGIPGKHLIFSQPVQIRLKTPNYSDGILIDIAALHTGNADFNTGGLSIDKNTACTSDGSATIPGSQAVVQGGEVVFYTCGASSFTVNFAGGVSGSNDLRLAIGDYGQVQIYYNGLAQVFGGIPPASGAGGPNWVRLNIGNSTVGNGGTAWTTATTTGSQNGNTYTATTTMTYKKGNLLYTLVIDWAHTAPNNFLTWTYRLTVPSGNLQNVRLYFAQNSFVGGTDTNDVGYFSNSPTQTIGVYDNITNVLSAQRYLSGQVWTGYYAGTSATTSSMITNNQNYPNTITTTPGDLGYGMNWDFGSTAGTYTSTVEWRVLPYVSSNTVDIVPALGQPEGLLVVGNLSQIPMNLTNVGTVSSSGSHTFNLLLPTGVTGPNSPFNNNGWSCGAQSGNRVSCTKTTNIAPLSTEAFRIPITPTASVQGQTLTFTGSFGGGGDANTLNNIATTRLQVAVAANPAKYPGGISGSSLWLNAGTGLILAGSNVTAWSDISGSGKHATQSTSTRQPLYSSYGPNYNPIVYFTSTAQTLTSTGNSTYRTVFAVRNLLGTGYQYLFSAPAGSDFSIRNSSTFNGTTSVGYTAGPTVNDWSFTGSLAVNGRLTNTGKKDYHIVRAVSGAPVTGTYGISNTYLSRGMTAGDGVAELIAFPTTLTAVATNKVESYLALKYGITLDQSTAQNYVLSNDTIAWSALASPGYNKDIAGIVRDDNSGLNQLKSQSINDSLDITVSGSTLATNGVSLVWGNDGGNTGIFTSQDTPAGTMRISRAWRFEENNGDTGNVTISYNAISIPSGLSGGVSLFVSSSSNFSGATLYPGTFNASTYSWEFTINIADGNYISFGGLMDTIPPVMTEPSLASGSLLPIGDFSISIGYSDNYTVADSTFDTQIFAWNATLGTWDTTNIAPTYAISSGVNGSTGTVVLTHLPFGKYRFDFSVGDIYGNSTTKSSTYYVDAIEWSVSGDQYDMGTVIPGVQSMGSGELLVTVKTVGAGFQVKMQGSSSLIKGVDTLNGWDGSSGWGYDQFTGGSYDGILTSASTEATLAQQALSINQNGEKNTYIYHIKYGSKVSTEQYPGQYNGNMQFSIVANY